MTDEAGYFDNQEDSILVNKSALDRGMFRVFTYKSISTSEKKHASNDNQVIQLPPDEIRVNHKYCYDKLDKDGLVSVGEWVEEFDVLVGKVRISDDEVVQDCSIICKNNEHGIVDDVCVTTNEKGYKHVKIRIRRDRVPEIGDKFCHVSAQKGTIGMIYATEDMPFSMETGLAPDIIINAHCLPSRMTINMIMEMLSGKASAVTGETHDGTAFQEAGEDVIEALQEQLKAHGYSPSGSECYVNGMTGRVLEAKVFVGMGYYQRLKHMASDKIHARSRGHVQMLSRQPCSGRSRAGGKRLPQWCVKSLLVCLISCNVVKMRETLKWFNGLEYYEPTN